MTVAGLAAFAALLIPAPTATIVAGVCPDGSYACADRTTNTVYVPPAADRFTREHELAHLYDAQRLDDGERAKLRRLFGLSKRPWRNGTGLAGIDSPSERFADAYAACRIGLDPDRRWETGYGYQPSRLTHQRVCATIARARD